MKKQILISLILISSVLTMNAQTRVPNDGLSPIWYNNGSVGIGGFPIDNRRLLIWGADNLATGIALNVKNLQGENILTCSNDASVHIGLGEVLKVFRDGNIAIGGASIAGRRVMIWGDNFSTGTALDVKNSIGEDILSCNNDVSVNIGWGGALNILRNGNILINKSAQTNSSYKLDVAGKIRADEIVVNTTGADFVFENDYKLMPLNELEKFVMEQKHLPEIATAKEMKENGTDLGNLNSKLLQKMEEMTLYMIEQNKKIEVLQNEIKEMKAASK